MKDSFTLPTILAIGALLQTLCVALLPARYVLLPLAFLIGRSIISTILEIRTQRTNRFSPGVIPGRVTAQLPLGPSYKTRSPLADGTPVEATVDFGHEAAATPLVAFHLGVNFYHPLGLLSPGAREIGAHFRTMTADLSARRDELGMVGMSTWRGTERSSNNAIMLIAYFRTVADLNRFAHDKVHRDGWDWYHQFVKETGYRHIGIYHETFSSRPGEWETIYVDCEPILAGGGSLSISGRGKDGTTEKEPGAGEEKEMWIRPLVSANHPALKSQANRMRKVLNMEEDLERNKEILT